MNKTKVSSRAVADPLKLRGISRKGLHERFLSSFAVWRSLGMTAGLIFAASFSFAATTLGSLSLNHSNIQFESNGSPTTITLSYTTGGDNASIAIQAKRYVNGVPTTVETISAGTVSAGVHTFQWDGQYSIDGGVEGRNNGTFLFSVAATSTVDSTVATATSGDFQITSVDVHTIVVSTATTPPFSFTYKLARSAAVTAKIRDSNGVTLRTLFTDSPRLGEGTDLSVINTETWDAMDSAGKPVTAGTYTLALTATNQSTNDQALERTDLITVTSGVDPNSDPSGIFKENAFPYPNPVRQAPCHIQALLPRAANRLSIRIYTLDGSLVREEIYGSTAAGTVITFDWDLKNDGGSKVARGLYFVIFRAEDPLGVLQTTKKLLVLP